TDNPGGEYKLWVTSVADYNSAAPSVQNNFGFTNGDEKSDNFKVRNGNTFATSITTSASPTSGTEGSATLTDSATLTGSDGAPTPAGTITWVLTRPDNSTVSESTTVDNGFTTYYTPFGISATEEGTYQWQAYYSGDSATGPNLPSQSILGDEPVTISDAP